MKIDPSILKTETANFGSIDRGVLFVFNQCLFLKIASVSGTGSSYNAVDLSHQCLSYFQDGHMVSPRKNLKIVEDL